MINRGAHWAWRWSDNNEPAFLVRTTFPMLHSTMVKTVCDANLIDSNRPVRSAAMPVSQWRMWLAFDLCPAIEIYRGSKDTVDTDDLQWRRITS